MREWNMREWNMREWNNRITIAVILIVVAVLVGRKPLPESDRNFAIAAGDSTAPTSTPSPSNGSPRLLKLNLSLTSPKDLKVRQGDRVTAGEVLADRVEERSRLTVQRRSLDLAIQQIQTRVIQQPPVPKVPPVVKNLPPVSYAEEEASIRSAAMAVREAQRALEQQSEVMKTAPLEESSAADLARVKVEDKQRSLQNQQRKLDAVSQLKDLPPEVAIHEQEVLKQREAQLQQATAEYQQASAKLTAAMNASQEKLTNLATALSKARAEHNLAIAKLQTKKDSRAYTEYEASVTAARRAEENNQAQQSYYRQLQDHEQQQRERSFQLAQLTSKIAEVDDKLNTLSVVTSPYAGTVRRIKFVRQTDNNLSVELTLVVGRESSSPNSTPSAASTGSSSFNSKPFATPAR